MRIERERTVSADAIGGGELLHVDDHSDKVAQSGLMKHRAFGLACRTGSVNHISQTIGIRQVDRLCIGHIRHEVVDEESPGSRGVEVAFGLFGLQNIVRGNQHF